MPTDQPRWESEGLAGSDRQPIIPIDVNKASRALSASVQEATKQKNNPQVLPKKMADVIENLQQVAQAMGGEIAPVEVTQVADPGDLLEAAEDLAKQLRARSFSDDVLRAAASKTNPVSQTNPVPQTETALPGEKAVEVAFEIASYISLRDADSESWGRKAATAATSDSSKEVKAVVKTVNYLLGPSALTVINDLTKMAGDAVKNINAERLKQSVTRVDTALQVLSATAKAIQAGDPSHQTPASAPASPYAMPLAPPSTRRRTVSPPSEHRLPDPPPRSPSSDRKHRPPSSPGAPGLR